MSSCPRERCSEDTLRHPVRRRDCNSCIILLAVWASCPVRCGCGEALVAEARSIVTEEKFSRSHVDTSFMHSIMPSRLLRPCAKRWRAQTQTKDEPRQISNYKSSFQLRRTTISAKQRFWGMIAMGVAVLVVANDFTHSRSHFPIHPGAPGLATFETWGFPASESNDSTVLIPLGPGVPLCLRSCPDSGLVTKNPSLENRETRGTLSTVT